MLYKNSDRPKSVAYDADDPVSTSDAFDLRWLIVAVLQRRWLIIVCPLILITLAALFVVFRSPIYTASTQLQLTNLRLTFSREDTFFAETHPDPAFLETQLQIIRSDRVALSVLNTLELLDADASVERKAAALEKLRRGFVVDRAGLSNVVQISYTSQQPDVAARVANEFAKSYIAELNAARLDAAQSGSSWLRDRLREVGPKARVIAEALPPPHKGNLRGIFIIAAAAIIGGGLAVAAAIAWKLIDRRVVTPEEAAAATGTACLGTVPLLPDLMLPVTEIVEDAPSETYETDADAGPHPDANAAAATDNAERTFSVHPWLLENVLRDPPSPTWHTLRNVEAACQDCFSGRGLRCLGVSSTFAGEGRSTIATALALSIAATNKRVLLVDGDVYDPELSRTLAGEGSPGLIDYLRDEESYLDAYVLVEPHTKLNFMPIGRSESTATNIWTDAFRRFLEEASLTYDLIIFDMPTLGMGGDIRASAHFVDGFLLVVGWKQASKNNIEVGINAASSFQDRLVGSVLNKVNTKQMRWTLSPQNTFWSRQNNSVHGTRLSYRTRFSDRVRGGIQLIGARGETE
ncbi:hypothetical protein W911_04390 [Hyphomicrobium nitrativorans NL23]|uniref:Polysaccharide chain length determinant N-terminal domain-containing protein n=1 Tax=Hyphomicrobium nitrativorans NL23 TaxID=1029756 RepID=V5SJ09_9HYPH|nr:Wzz/FepE/Etk N-terminal domain-containing protein [Hyphomicrobium nitrativorans]AHB49929.1 hypothetical protein W911_04390 [Hyphomicrobium nitrativorans NL23]